MKEFLMQYGIAILTLAVLVIATIIRIKTINKKS